jgi:hypothetical protein
MSTDPAFIAVRIARARAVVLPAAFSEQDREPGRERNR